MIDIKLKSLLEETVVILRKLEDLKIICGILNEGDVEKTNEAIKNLSSRKFPAITYFHNGVVSVSSLKVPIRTFKRSIERDKLAKYKARELDDLLIQMDILLANTLPTDGSIAIYKFLKGVKNGK